MRLLGCVFLCGVALLVAPGCGPKPAPQGPAPANKDGGQNNDALKTAPEGGKKSAKANGLDDFFPPPGDGTAQAQPVSGAPKKDTPAAGIIGAGARAEARNELRQLGQFYNTYALTNNRSPRTVDELTAYFKTDAPALHKAVGDGYYAVNLKGQPVSTNSILAYEAQPSSPAGHIVVKGDGSVHTLSAQELKQALGQ
jgi:hypothetical protein